MSVPFEAGERALLLDRKGRRYLITLRIGGEFHTHRGFLRHDELLGRPEGTSIESSGGATFVAVRPSLTDFVLKMPRGAQVVYPKDIATILVAADIAPGSVVLEAGTGSGALTIALVRAVGEHGRVISYEAREDHQQRARANIEAFLGKVPDTLELRLGDVTVGVDDTGIDRVVLDLPEPWRVIETAQRASRPGALFCSYVPTVPQVAQTAEALRGAGFIDVSTTETLVRSWRVEGMSVRPDHRMVAHTGFITIARFLGPQGGGSVASM